MLTVFVNFILLVFVVGMLFSSIRIIRQSSVGIVERLGKFHKKAEQGINVIMPLIDTFRAKVDLREQVVDFRLSRLLPRTTSL